MQLIDAIEKSLAEFMRTMPHLSRKWRQEIAKNIWWIVATTAVLAVLYLLWLGAQYFFASNISAWLGALGFGTMNFAFWLPFAFYLGAALMLIASASGLQKMTMKGWRGLFVAWLFMVVAKLFATLIHFNMTDLLWDVLTLAFICYAVFEIRDEFSQKSIKPSQPKNIAAKKRSPKK